jgi:hypothetical protein
MEATQEGASPSLNIFTGGSRNASARRRHPLQPHAVPSHRWGRERVPLKITMAVESLRRSEPARAGELFHGSLAENHLVASGWLGLAYIEALNAGRRRDALETLRYSLYHVARTCPHQDVVNDSCAQILATAATKAAILAGRSFNSYAEKFRNGIQNMEEAAQSAASRDRAIVSCTVLAVVASRSKNRFFKFIGYAAAASAGTRAVGSHLNSRQQQLNAEANAKAAAEARQIALTAGYAAYQCLREAVRL